MKKLTSLPMKVKITLIALIITATAFGIYNLIWFQNTRKIDSFVNSLSQFDTTEISYNSTLGFTEYRYVYENDDGSFIEMSINKPAYLKPYVSFYLLTQTLADFEDDKLVYISEYQIRLDYDPKTESLILGLATMPKYVEDGFISYGSAVDRNGMPLGRHPEDTEDFYAEWLSLYETYNEQIDDIFETVKTIFGENVFSEC